MISVTSSELQKHFGKYKEKAQREPIAVTSNGRQSVVLLSSAEYNAYLEYKQSRCAYHGDVDENFKNEVDDFMALHTEVLAGLAK